MEGPGWTRALAKIGIMHSVTQHQRGLSPLVYSGVGGDSGKTVGYAEDSGPPA